MYKELRLAVKEVDEGAPLLTKVNIMVAPCTGYPVSFAWYPAEYPVDWISENDVIFHRRISIFFQSYAEFWRKKKWWYKYM